LTIILIATLQFSFAQKDTRPNIIYIMTDDLGYADLSCYGRKDYQTPNLDKLCSQGIKFMKAYASAPVCTPTRVAFMTGQYPARLTVGLYEPIAERSKDSLVGLTTEIPSLPSLMKNAGYETYLVGKWHLGYQKEFNPNANGFDYFFGFHAGATDYISHSNQNGKPDLYENDQPVSKDGYLTDILKEKVIDIINKKHENPFFISVMFSAPHWPWQVSGDNPYPFGSYDKWVSGGSAETYASMMKNLDSAVGRIVKAVDENKLSKNTVIIFTSDNGGERFSDMGIYRGAKMTLWEGGIRVPAFVRWTGKIKKNTETNQVATTTDWTATILSLGNAKIDEGFPLDGIDLTSILTGKQNEVDRTLYWRITQRNQHKAMRDGKWKWMQDEKGDEYLFDLIEDPSEKNDLKEKKSAIFQQLKNKYSEWERTMLKPIPL
jgi:arylsulfatase A-like enzyme